MARDGGWGAVEGRGSIHTYDDDGVVVVFCADDAMTMLGQGGGNPRGVAGTGGAALTGFEGSVSMRSSLWRAGRAKRVRTRGSMSIPLLAPGL
nr:hypothetical protein CFP56_21724 [Quercus suber]